MTLIIVREAPGAGRTSLANARDDRFGPGPDHLESIIYDARPVDQREEEVVLETDRYRVTGKLTLPREGYRSRLSDYVNQRDREFFALSEVTLRELDAPEQIRHASFLMVARGHVRLITLAAEDSSSGASG